MTALPWKWRRYDPQALMAELEAPGPEPTIANLDAGLTTLQSMITALSSASDSANTKAGLVPVAVAGIAALLVGHVHTDVSQWTLVFGWLTLGLLGTALVASLAVLVPLSHETGPKPRDVASKTAVNESKYKAGIANRLAIAATDLSDLVNAKGEWLRISLIAVGLAVLCLAVFWLLGGLR